MDYREIAFIDFPIFGIYQKVFDTIKEIPKEELTEQGYIHNSFAKLNMNDVLMEIMMCQYFSINIYKDIEYICKTFILDRKLDMEESIVAVKKLEAIRLELYKLMSNWESKQYEVDTVLESSYKLSLTAKNKEGILGYSTGLPSLDKYTD